MPAVPAASGRQCRQPAPLARRRRTHAPRAGGMGASLRFWWGGGGRRRRQAHEQGPAACGDLEAERWGWMEALVLHLRRRWRKGDGPELRAWGDAALPRWGKGRCGGAGATLFAPVGQRRCCVARLILAGLRGKACCGAVCLSGRAGRRAGRTGVGERSRQGMDIHVLRWARRLMGENAPFPDRTFRIAHP